MQFLDNAKRRRTVLIIGCSEGGTGNALVKEYHAQGTRVFATARRLEAMENLTSLDGVTLLILDVTSVPSIESVYQKVARLLKEEELELDLLVNNAGIASVLPIADMTLPASHNIIQTNLLGPMNMVHIFMPLLLKAASRGGVPGPCIVNTGSIAGLMPIVGGSYNASKAGLELWSDSLRLELKPFNIHVLHLIMGFIDTPLWGHAQEQLPPGSGYAPIEKSVINFKLSFRVYSISPSQFSRRVVDATSKPSPLKELYIGGGATTFWILSRVLPNRLRDFWISYLTGLQDWELRCGADEGCVLTLAVWR